MLNITKYLAFLFLLNSINGAAQQVPLFSNYESYECLLNPSLYRSTLYSKKGGSTYNKWLVSDISHRRNWIGSEFFATTSFFNLDLGNYSKSHNRSMLGFSFMKDDLGAESTSAAFVKGNFQKKLGYNNFIGVGAAIGFINNTLALNKVSAVESNDPLLTNVREIGTNLLTVNLGISYYSQIFTNNYLILGASVVNVKNSFIQNPNLVNGEDLAYNLSPHYFLTSKYFVRNTDSYNVFEITYLSRHYWGIASVYDLMFKIIKPTGDNNQGPIGIGAGISSNVSTFIVFDVKFKVPVYEIPATFGFIINKFFSSKYSSAVGEPHLEFFLSTLFKR